MDKIYDGPAAKAALSAIIEEYVEEKKYNTEDDQHLSFFKSEGHKVCSIGTPSVYKLVKLSDGSSELEEVMFVVHGVIIEKDLPPIQPDSYSFRGEKEKRKLAAFIRQYVAITGLGLERFNQSLEGLARVHKYFEDHLPANKLERLEPTVIDDHLSIASHTRYFQPRNFLPSAVPYTFRPEVDPNGDLLQIAGSSHVHTQDNAVQYLGEKKVDGRSVKSYINISPVRFQKGDLVQVTVSFLCVRNRQGKYKMLTSLKSLMLINDEFREKARADQVRHLLARKATNPHVKRRFVETEEDESPDSKFARMDIA